MFRNKKILKKISFLVFSFTFISNANHRAISFCSKNLDSFIYVLLPLSGSRKNEIKNILLKAGPLKFTTKFKLNKNGQKNLLEEFYGGHPSDGHHRAYFPDKCLDENGFCEIEVCVVTSDSKETIHKVKKEVRQTIGIHHVIHSTDDQKETIEMAKLMFNNNSIDFLNKRISRKFSNFTELLKCYKNWLEKNKVKQDFFCIDGSGTLAAYGLRDCQDLDFLHHSYENLVANIPYEYVGSHNGEMVYHTKTKSEIIFWEDNYFYYKGLKFVALNVLRDMKQKRQEVPKDINDLILINNILN